MSGSRRCLALGQCQTMTSIIGSKGLTVEKETGGEHQAVWSHDLEISSTICLHFTCWWTSSCPWWKPLPLNLVMLGFTGFAAQPMLWYMSCNGISFSRGMIFFLSKVDISRAIHFLSEDCFSLRSTSDQCPPSTVCCYMSRICHCRVKLGKLNVCCLCFRIVQEGL